MAYKVIYLKRFNNKLAQLQAYLQNEWGDKVVKNFIETLYNKINNIKIQPNIGLASTNFKDTRSILISKHNRLVYRISKKQIIVIDLIDTRQKIASKKY